jgi:hypothetical protein
MAEWSGGFGVIAATTAMILKLNSMSEFMMWQTSMLFENVGTIQDGMQTLGKPVNIQDKPNAKPLIVSQAILNLRMSVLPTIKRTSSIILILISAQVKKLVSSVVQVQENQHSFNCFYIFIPSTKVVF